MSGYGRAVRQDWSLSPTSSPECRIIATVTNIVRSTGSLASGNIVSFHHARHRFTKLTTDFFSFCAIVSRDIDSDDIGDKPWGVYIGTCSLEIAIQLLINLASSIDTLPPTCRRCATWRQMSMIVEFLDNPVPIRLHFDDRDRGVGGMPERMFAKSLSRNSTIMLIWRKAHIRW
jgi:hypothetical protein